MRPTITTNASPDGVTVEVELNGQGQPLPPTRYALIMRRERANMARKVNGRQQLPALRPGSCQDCDGLGVVGRDRDRCRVCGGSGDS